MIFLFISEKTTIIRHKRIGYNLNVLRQYDSINPITVNNYAACLNDCTLVGRASDYD